MKKIISMLLASVMSLSAMASVALAAGEENAYTGAEHLQGWTIGDASDRCTVERVFDTVTNSWCAKITYDSTKGGASARTMLQYTVPQSLLTSGHTYKVNLYLRSEGFSGNNWGHLYLGNTKKEPFMGHITGGNTRADTGIDLYSNNTIRFTLSHPVSGIVYLDNLKITDEQTGEELTLENPDFETPDMNATYTKVENAEFADGILTWEVPVGMVGDGINVYKRDINGNKVKLNDETIPAADLSAEFDVDLESDESFYIDIYTCIGDAEVTWMDTLVSCPVLGNYDIANAKLCSGGTEIDAPEAGELTVKLPVRNNYLTEGVDFEIIVLLKDGKKTLRVKAEEYTAPISDDFVDYPVNINVDSSELTQNTTIEVYVWDGIDSMNVLKDVSIF